eukprot:SM000002S05669  [mRNA]  locus=s2:1464191:1470880:- [translate_table: standard]
MAANPQLDAAGAPVPFEGETFVLARGGVEFAVDKLPGKLRIHHADCAGADILTQEQYQQVPAWAAGKLKQPLHLSSGKAHKRHGQLSTAFERDLPRLKRTIYKLGLGWASADSVHSSNKVALSLQHGHPPLVQYLFNSLAYVNSEKMEQAALYHKKFLRE